jgi:hypothetical protein
LDLIPQMEPQMISLKVLSTAAVTALVLPMAAPTTSFAQDSHGKAGFAARGAAAAPAARMGGGAPAARFSGGGGGVPAARFSGGGGGVPAARFSGGGGAPTARFNGGGAPVAQYSGGGGVYRGGYAGGYRRDYDRDRGGGFIPGAVAGAVVGGALASSYGYYGGPGYYDQGYTDDQYYDDGGAVAVAPGPVGGDDGVAYCMQTYRSYDPASGTYAGYDGLRHPCP